MKLIYVMADTLRRDHVGAYGNDWIHTPNLDWLAGRSAVFEKAYIGSFPTVPNRRDTLLGRGDLGLPFNRWKPFEREEITLPQRLAARNVPCMWIGDTQNNVTNGINMYKGFTAWRLNRGQEGDPCWLDETVCPDVPVPAHLIRYTAPWWHQVVVNRARRRVETDWFAPGTYKLAIEWLECNYKRPDFLLWIDTFDPHEPWDPPQYYTDLYDPGYKGRVFEAPTYGLRRKMGITAPELRQIRARYAGEVTMVDNCVGRLLNALERLGILDETWIVFTSDHGTMFDGPGDNGLLCKANTIGADGMCMSAGRPMTEPRRYFPIYPNVARLPLLIRPPEMGRPKRIGAVVQPWDMTATILDVFGMPKAPELIGRSLLPLIRGEAKRTRDTAVCGTGALAQAMAGRWIYTAWRGQRGSSLIDLRADPLAKRNVLKKHPAVVRRLHGRIERFLREQGIAENYVAAYGRPRAPAGGKAHDDFFAE